MPRQLQSNTAKLGQLNRTVELSEGGTSATTRDQAVQNLGGLPVASLGQPNGPIQADAQGKLPSSYLTSSGISVGYAIDGPVALVNGQTSIFYLTNWSNNASVSVSVSAGSASIVNDEIHVTAPTTGTEVTLTIGDRDVVLPVIPSGAQTPVIVSPTPNSENPFNVTFRATPFNTAAEIYTDWNLIEAPNASVVNIPSNAIGVELYGKRGTAGAAYATLGTSNYQLGVSTTRRRILFNGQTTLNFWRTGTGEIQYRWILPRASHTATDWEVSTRSDFATIAASSYNNTVNKTEWSATLNGGSYFVRARYYGTINA